jgi:hypothetical protein
MLFVPLFWAPILHPSKNRERDGTLALGGYRLVKRHNNQPKVGESDSRDCGEELRQGRSVWGGCCLFVRDVKPSNKKKKKRGSNKALALGGCDFTIKTNNQPIFRGSGRWNDRGRLGGAGHVGGMLYHCFGASTPATKNNKNVIHCGLRWPPKTIF